MVRFNKNEGGCSYGKVTRSMVENNRETLQEIKEGITNINNHYSQRLPAWATGLLTFSGILIGILAGIAFS